jgi:hypothetical protein
MSLPSLQFHVSDDSNPSSRKRMEDRETRRERKGNLGHILIINI